MTRREFGFLAATAVVTAIAGVLRYTDASAVAAFAAATVALAGLAWVVAVRTEQVAIRFGPAVTGLAQALAREPAGILRGDLRALLG